jgi:hypothetical protein
VIRALILFAVLTITLPATADEDRQAWCAGFFEHVHGLLVQNEGFAAKYAEMTPEEKQAFRQEGIDACLDEDDPAERKTMECVMEQATFEGMQTCMQPAMEQQQLRIKRAEAPTTLDGLRTAERAYHAEFDRYMAIAATPVAIPGADGIPFEGPGKAAFDELGAFLMFDSVRCRYSVRLVADDGTPVKDGFEARAECDIDGDGVIAVYRATASQGATMVTPADVF